MTKPTPVLVDCDPGVDDAVALLYLLAHPDVEIVGVTTVFGNNTAAVCAQNAARVLELGGAPDVPIAVGAEDPLVGTVAYLATHVHGDDGLGDAGLPPAAPGRVSDRPVADLYAELAARHRGDLRILAIGPLTNLARALDEHPWLPDAVADVVVMGGAADVAGNQSPAAEANIIHDPEAAQRVLAAGWPVTLVPLDVTMRETLTEEHRRRLVEAGTPVAAAVAGITDFYFEHYGRDSYGHRRSPCHDALAAGILAGDVVPSVLPRIAVEVDCTQGPSRGATICDTRGRWRGFPDQADGNCRVALETAGDFAEILLARLGA